MSFIEVLTANGLTVENWEKEIFSTYIGKLIWKPFMGTGSGSMFQVKQDLTKKKGDAITIGIRGRIQGGQVTGNAKAKDNEGTLVFYNQRFVVDNVRRAVKIEDIPMTEQRTMFGVLKEARAALEDEFSVDLDKAITEGMMGDLSTGKVQGRYLYGILNSNYDATHATALATIDNTADKLSTKMVSIAKRKATLPVNAVNKIRPIRVKNGKNHEEWFTMFAHDYCIRDLVENDSAWLNAQLNIPPRSGSSNPIFTGSHFKGAWDGVLIYQHSDLDLSTNTNSIQVAHNLLMGAQAGAIVWAQKSKFAEEGSDFGHDVAYELHEIRNIGKLVFNSTDGGTQEDNGVINIFAAAVAD